MLLYKLTLQMYAENDPTHYIECTFHFIAIIILMILVFNSIPFPLESPLGLQKEGILKETFERLLVNYKNCGNLRILCNFSQDIWWPFLVLQMILFGLLVWPRHM